MAGTFSFLTVERHKMSVKLADTSAPKIVRVSQMKDGQLGVIVGSEYDGRVVMCLKAGHCLTCTTLFSVGQRNGKSWDVAASFPIRLLQPGELIEVVENEGA